MAEPAVIRVDVAVVGAGPAGVAAALAAAGCGKRVCLLDEGFRPGGQIWRHRAHEAPPAAKALLRALARSGAQVLAGASVFDGWRQDGAWRLAASGPGGRIDLEAQALVLACGARELFAPFPGWTLPGVLGAGGGQALLKEGLELNGEPVLVAGSGPLLLPAAASARRHGGRLEAVLEQAPWGRLAGMAPLLAARPGKALQALGLGLALLGTPYRPGWWVAEALGTDRLEQVRITDGRRERLIPCRWLFCGFGLVPNLELGRLLGCATASGAFTVDGSQHTSLARVYAAGEVCGVAGVDAALAEGRIAGLAAAGAWDPSGWADRLLVRARRRARAMGGRLEEIFALRSEVLALPRPDTLVCRCEDVPFGAIDPAWGARETKLCTRAGMGPCQGRVCGPILARRFGHEPDTVRVPVKCVPLGQLMDQREEAVTGSGSVPPDKASTHESLGVPSWTPQVQSKSLKIFRSTGRIGI
jgi:NADPH-dependent 2,4-dienoyl-CoA reductase/sulfur reductase-like enzyme